MIKKEELKEWDLDRVNKEIDDRYKLLDMMVGTLYPSVLRDELEQLFERRGELNGHTPVHENK